MGFYKNDSDGRKTTLFPSSGDGDVDTLYATERGLVTKAGGTDDPNAEPEVLVTSRGLDDAWGTAHLVGFEWKTGIRSRLKDSFNSEATLAPTYGGSGLYTDRIRTEEYSVNTGDWRGMLLACTAHFSEPVWVTGTNNISPRLKVTLTEPGGGGNTGTIYLPWKNTDLYASDYVNDPVPANGMTHYQYRNSYLYPNGSSSVTFAVEEPFSLGIFGFVNWIVNSTFEIPENAIDLNTSGTIKEGTSAGGTNAIITNSVLRGEQASTRTVFHQLGELWVNF
mgnify:CR=1 FL=1|jgi:hypothetical protein